MRSDCEPRHTRGSAVRAVFGVSPVTAGRARVLGTVTDGPADARRQLETLNAAGTRVAAIVGDGATLEWPVFANLAQRFPSIGGVQRVAPRSYWWPNFLKGENLLNVANQIVVIAVIAIGMTMVIITVIQNGMNRTGVESYTQKVILGAVILGAVSAGHAQEAWLERRGGTDAISQQPEWLRVWAMSKRRTTGLIVSLRILSPQRKQERLITPLAGASG